VRHDREMSRPPGAPALVTARVPAGEVESTMAGQLPIDRVRANEDAPATHEREKQRFAKKQAELREEAARREERPAPSEESAAERAEETEHA
jgi:hypothetical protein